MTTITKVLFFGTFLGAAVAQLFDNPCDVDVWPDTRSSEYIERTVPGHCTNGTFRWDYPRKTVLLHFPPAMNGHFRSVCVRNQILGNVFTVRDATHTLGMPMLIGEKESCTIKHDKNITLRIDAPDTLYYMAALWYRLKVE
ncbi:uncharacterized protein LOC128236561 [Mya arenaria]|uniref:uncharacterized protein LOC128236561 n=1 Tax=Mya arenaria TaxID=6604 RepID=UPI0022E753F8|nr:uncharacterized protein LOC128236561 [Mya arenaria]